MSGLGYPVMLPIAHVPATRGRTVDPIPIRGCVVLIFPAVHDLCPITIQSGQIDTSGDGGGPNPALDAFPSIRDKLRLARDDDLFCQPGYRFWIVLRDRVPILTFEQDDGMAWTSHHVGGFDLVGLYELSRHHLAIVTLDLLRLADNV